MSEKLPWFPFYGRDFFGDEKVLLFSLRQVGMYLNLLWHQWEEGSIPSAELCLSFPLIRSEILQARLAGIDPSAIEKELADLHAKCFTAHRTILERFCNERLEGVRREQEKISRLNKQRAVNSWKTRKNKGTSDHMVTKSSPSGHQLVTNASQSQSHSQTSGSSDLHLTSEPLLPLEMASSLQAEGGTSVAGEGEKNLQAPAPKKSAKPADDEAWIAHLQKSLAYRHLNVRVQLEKCRVWCDTNSAILSRRRFINWLNREDKPMKAGAASGKCVAMTIQPGRKFPAPCSKPAYMPPDHLPPAPKVYCEQCFKGWLKRNHPTLKEHGE